jgi:osmoprotectant transport system ATP-binding protein
MIHIERATKRYGDAVAVDALTMDVDAGQVCVLIGPSGCGKTTTLRMINRLVEPSDGRILINGRDTRESQPELLRRTIGYAIQSVGLFPHMTVSQNIEVVPRILGWDRGRIDRRIQDMLHLVGLDASDYGAKYPSQLSGGEAQRVGVARALAADPPILLMDEPFGAVDPLTRERLQQQFLTIQRELRKTVILVTHDLDEAVKLADTVAVMRHGRLLQHDTPEALLSRPADEFVTEFVGVDRALKRLSRIPVTSLTHPAPHVVQGLEERSPGISPERRYVWITDADGRLLGWLDTRCPTADTGCVAINSSQMDRFAVRESATVREALSRMLSQGMRSVPVIDEQQRLTGEVTLHDIEEVTAD